MVKLKWVNNLFGEQEILFKNKKIALIELDILLNQGFKAWIDE